MAEFIRNSDGKQHRHHHEKHLYTANDQGRRRRDGLGALARWSARWPARRVRSAPGAVIVLAAEP